MPQQIANLNAYTITFDPDALAKVQKLYTGTLAPFLSVPENQTLFRGGQVIRHPLPTPEAPFFIYSYDDYPLLWFSNHNQTIYRVFEDFYQTLDLAQQFKPKLKHHKSLQLYCGFFVIGDRAPAPLWHEDYRSGAQAMTLITPLFELAPHHGHLLYQDPAQNTVRYAYHLGEAIVFGAGFLHSTEPYPLTPQKRVLLSLTFGSDRWQDWPLIQKNISQQSPYYHLPCGHAQGQCLCKLKSQFAGFLRSKGQI